MKYIIMMIILLPTFVLGYVEQHVKIVKARSAQLKKGSLTSEDIVISNCDFREAGDLLQDIYLPGVMAAGVNFGLFHNKQKQMFSKGPTDLTGANFSNANLESANFEGCVLKNVNFKDANIMKANFANADLTGADFKGAENIDFAVFCGATMPDGTVCNMETWKSKRGTMFTCHCPKK